MHIAPVVWHSPMIADLVPEGRITQTTISIFHVVDLVDNFIKISRELHFAGW